jgi:hypothetical protein
VLIVTFIWPRKVRLPLVLLSLVVLGFTRVASAQQDAGIVGQVTDESGAVLPGVTVTATSPALQVPSQIDVTNARGEYRLMPLPIGSYELTYELPGFQSMRREGIRLTVEFVAKVDIVLKVGSVAETITVSGAAPVVDVASTGASTRLTTETLQLIPTSRNGVVALMVQAPGVKTNIDVGGSSIGVPPVFKAFGQTSQGWTQIEGVVMITAKEGSQGGSVYWDYSTLEEAQIQAIGGDADTPTRGVQIKAVLKSGGNQFHGTGFFGGTGSKLQGDNVGADLQAQGVSSGAGIRKRWDASGDLGGRIIKDRLWFYAGTRHRSESYQITECFKPDGDVCDAFQNQQFNTGKLSYQPNQANRLVGIFHRGTKAATYGGGSPSRVVAWEARANQESTGKFGKTEWQFLKGSSFVSSLQYGAWTWHGPWRGYSDRPGTTDLITTVVTGSNTAAGRHQFEYRHGPKATVTLYKPDLFLGNHQLRAGFDYLMGRANFTYVTTEADRELKAGAPIYQLQLRSGVPYRVIFNNYPTNPNSRGNHLGVYLQDSWNIARRVTLNLGVRVAKDDAFAPEQCRDAADAPANLLYPAGCFDEIRTPTWKSVVPRLRASWDLFGDGRTSLKGGWGRFARIHYTEDSELYNANVATSTTFTWRDLDNDRLFDVGEANLDPNGPDFVSSTGTARLANKQNLDLKQPFSDEFSLTLERELVPNLAIRFTGLYTKTGNAFRVDNPLRPYSAYNIPITRPDPGPDGVTGNGDDPGTAITYFDYPASFAGLAFNQQTYVNDPAANQNFKSFELAAIRRLANRWQFQASYSRTKKHIPFTTAGNASSNSVLAVTPNDEILAEDNTSETIARASATYTVPHIDVLFSGNLEHRNGDPYARTALITGGTRIPSLTLRMERIGSEQLPDVNLLDFTMQKMFRMRGGRTASVRANLYNALNAGTITAITVQSGSNYGKPNEILLPRIIEFSTSFSF